MDDHNSKESLAELVMFCSDLNEDSDFLSKIGFKLNQIYPSDDPSVARMSGHGLNIRLIRDLGLNPQTVNILTDDPESISSETDELKAPNGVTYKLIPKSYVLEMPATQHKFEVRKLRDEAPWVIGRAGMLYRDLIPDRLGGSIIASHIRIPDGGPVPDVVHYHTIGFQLIYCYQGWVKLVYEDQGQPFVLNAGDCVTQPPEIRHRVLEASENLEVIEIGVPADHMTTIDHGLELPNETFNPHREFQGHRFCHHKVKDADWEPWRLNNFEFRETGINESTKGVASVHVARVIDGKINGQLTSHDSDILFTFILSGSLSIRSEKEAPKKLNAGDAFVIPPNMKYSLDECSDTLEILEVSLPGNFKTVLH